jgi:hypothetical protein
MANTNAPFGFQHMGWSRGGPGPTGATVERKIAAAYSVAIGKGDVVINQSSTPGYVQRGTAGVAGGNTAGIFIGCKYLSTALGRLVYSSYWPTGDHAYDGTAFIVPIAGVPPQLFKVQSLLTNFTIADIGKTVDIDAGAVVVTGGFAKSTMTVSHALLSTASFPFKVVDLYSSVAPAGVNGTDDTSSYNIVLVESNPWAEATL